MSGDKSSLVFRISSVASDSYFSMTVSYSRMIQAGNGNIISLDICFFHLPNADCFGQNEMIRFSKS